MAVFLSYSVSALGVAHSVIEDNVLYMDKDSSMSFRFILQNADDEEKTMIFKVKTVFPMTVNDDDEDSEYEVEYDLSPNSNKEEIVKFYSPDFDGEFPVTYSYREKASSTGQISIVQEVSGKFNINVGNCNDCFFNGLGIPLSYTYYNLVTYSKTLTLIPDLYIKSDLVEVRFLDEVNLTDFEEEYVHIEHNKIYVDAKSYPSLNVSARITFFNLSYNSTPEILKDGKLCKKPQCEINSYNKYSGKLVFEVEGFSEYTTRGTIAKKSEATVAGSPVASAEAVAQSSSDSSSVDSPHSEEVESQNLDSPAKSVADFLGSNDDDSSKKASPSVRSSVPVDDFQRAGAKKLFSTITYGFLTLIFSVGLLLTYARDRPYEIDRIINKK
jgi:hypothetical protein